MTSANMANSQDDTHGGISVEEKTGEKLKRPPMYVVLLHNDPVTPRGFVVEVLTRFFQKNSEQATRIMMLAHVHGMSAVGIYSHEVAETKASIATSYSQSKGYPLNFTYQEE